MKKIFSLLLGTLVILLLTTSYTTTPTKTIETESQIGGQLYFCEQYIQGRGPVGVGNRFTRGSLCVVADLGYEIGYYSVIIQIDRYDYNSDKYLYYNSFSYNVNPGYTLIYFNQIMFSTPGYYRVFLLTPNRQTLVWGTIEII